MKSKLIFLSLLFAFTTTAFAQKNKVQSAIIYEREGDIAKAKEAIDAASEHPSSNIMAKTWFYKASIYSKMLLDKNFNSLHPDPLSVLEEAATKCKELDTKKEYEKQMKYFDEIIKVGTFTKGVEAYEAKQYSQALIAFEKGLVNNENDTSLILNAAASAQNAENTEKTKYYLNRLLQLGKKKASIYQTLAQMELTALDTTAAMATLAKGLNEFPTDIGLIIDELNIYLTRNQSDKAIQKMEKATEIDPTNERLFFALGTAYEKIGEKTKAESAYKKAMEIDNKFFEPVYNLGALYFNEAVELANIANKIPYNQTKKFNEAEKAYKDKMKEAQPFLENALKLKDDDESTIFSLQQLYAKIGENAKSMEMKQKRDALRKK